MIILVEVEEFYQWTFVSSIILAKAFALFVSSRPLW